MAAPAVAVNGIETHGRAMRVRALAGGWLLYATYYFCRKNFSVAMPLMKQSGGYTETDFANLIFAFSLCYACAQFIAGNLADQFGSRIVGAAGALLSAVTTALMGLWGVPAVMLGLQSMNGLAQGCGWSSLIRLIGQWFVPAERGRALAVWGTSYVLGASVATVFATYVANDLPWRPDLGWHRAFLIPPLVLTLGGVVYYLLVRDALQHQPGAAPAKEPGGTWRESLHLIRANRDVQVLAMTAFFNKITRYSLMFWLPLYMVQRAGYTASDAGYLSSLFELVGFAGPLIAGYVSDKWMGGRRYPVGATMLTLLSLALVAHPFLAPLGMAAMGGSIALLGIMVYGVDLLMSGAASADSVAPHQVARAAGIVNCVGSMGQLVSSYAVAGIVKWWGWDKLFLFFVACSVVSAVLLALRGRAKEAERHA